MKWWLLPLLFWISVPESDPATATEDAVLIRQVYDESLTNSKAYEWLDYLANQIGGRLSGSPKAAMAVEWSRQVLDTLGLDSVWLQPVMVPHWIRGEQEVGRYFSPNSYDYEAVNVCALGGSVGTGAAGITAEVVEVDSYEQLAAFGEDSIRGRIVFYNTPMEQRHIRTFHAYGGCVGYRWAGAGKAAEYGAVGMLIRSLSHTTDIYPHTGSMHYPDEANKIPAAAIATLHADQLSEALTHDPSLRFHLRMSCDNLPDKLSYNVIGEIKGSEYPEEIILVGGHLDSWDNGDGAHDDGAGCVQSMEVLRLLQAVDYTPKRTLRCVLFMNEENGLRGAKKYAEESNRKGEYHLAAIESDAGGFAPQGFGISDTLPIVNYIREWKPLFAPYDIFKFEEGGGGADINQLRSQGTTLIGLMPESQRYFDYHHAATDVFAAVNRRELQLGAAAMTTLVYLMDRYGLPKE